MPQALINPKIGSHSWALEPNVIEVGGRIRVISCVKPVAQSTAGLAAVYDLDDDDLAVISRSNIDGPNRHDADCATFHRVRDFRRLALDLAPAEDA